MATAKKTLVEVIALLQDDTTIDAGISSPASNAWLAEYLKIKVDRQQRSVWTGTP